MFFLFSQAIIEDLYSGHQRSSSLKLSSVISFQPLNSLMVVMKNQLHFSLAPFSCTSSEPCGSHPFVFLSDYLFPQERNLPPFLGRSNPLTSRSSHHNSSKLSPHRFFSPHHSCTSHGLVTKQKWISALWKEFIKERFSVISLAKGEMYPILPHVPPLLGIPKGCQWWFTWVKYIEIILIT